MRLGADLVGRLGHVALGHGRRLGRAAVLDVGRPRRVVGADPGQLDGVEHVDGLVLDDLEGGDRPAELHPDLGVLDGQVVGLLHHPQQLGSRARRRRRRRSAARAAVWSPSGPTRSAARPSRSSRATLRVTSHVGHRLALRRLEEEGAEALLACGPPRGPSRPCVRRAPPASARRARQCPPLRWARVRTRSTGSPWPSSSSGDGPSGRARGQRPQLLVEPEATGGERGEHGRREVRARGREPAPSPRARRPCRPAPCRGPPCSSGTSSAGPAQLDELRSRPRR